MLGTSFTPAYNQLYDLDTQKTDFTNALLQNNKALAQYYFPALINAFLSTHQIFLPHLKTFLYSLARTIAPTCQLETMLYLCNLNHANQRILSLTDEQYITLMIETNDLPTFMYFLGTSNLSLQQIAPYLDGMTEMKMQAIQDLFAEEEEVQQAQLPRIRNGRFGA